MSGKTYTEQDVGHMLAALAIYEIGLEDLQFSEAEARDEELRDKTLTFVSEVLGRNVRAEVAKIKHRMRSVATPEVN